ncbi:MAG: tetratricopeptide repeat protein [Gammaproteobacteria bacterium]|nr:tetratricopeptide repeat protein [Gammaproteobacteria bacterium]
MDYEFTKARLIILLSRQPERYLEAGVLGGGIIEQYQKALAAIHSEKPKLAIKILKKLEKKSRHPWIRLALAEAYTAKNDDKNALQVLTALSNLYPGYLPATMALAKAFNNNDMPDKSILLLKNQLQTDDYGIIHEALAKAYYANGQISAALESTGNQYTRQGYIELAIQQYDNALKQKDISPSTRQRLESQKSELQKAIQRYKDQL